MMGCQSDYQHKLVVTGFNLEKRIHKDHILRKIAEKIDFHFIYDDFLSDLLMVDVLWKSLNSLKLDVLEYIFWDLCVRNHMDYIDDRTVF